jgi:hypothetical protein
MFAVAWLGMRYLVSVPLAKSSDYDVLAEIDGRIARVQVKTTRVLNDKGRWVVTLGGPKYAEYEVDPGPPLTLS